MVNFCKPRYLSYLAYCVVIKCQEAEKWSLACGVHILATASSRQSPHARFSTRRVGPPWVAAIAIQRRRKLDKRRKAKESAALAGKLV